MTSGIIKINKEILWNTIIPLLLILLNFILKIIYVSSNAIAHDEPFSIYHAQMNVASIIHHLKSGNNPPCYELFLHYWIKVFGISELSVRFPSVIFSCLTVYFIYRIGKDFFNLHTALISCLFFTFSEFHISIAHEARVYALFCLLTTMSMYYFLKLTIENARNKYFIYLILVNIIMIYSHYLGFFVLFLQTLLILGSSQFRTKLFKKYLVYLAAMVILYIPNIYILLTRFSETSANGTWVKAPDGVDSLFTILVRFTNTPVTGSIVILIMLTAFTLVIIRKGSNINAAKNSIIILWFLLPFFGMFLLSYRIPMFVDKYLVFVSPAFYLVLSISCLYLVNLPKLKLLIPLLLVGLFAATFNAFVDNKREVRETIAKISELKGKNDMLIICPKHFVLNFTYYYDQKVFQDVDNEKVYDKMLSQLKKQNIYATNTVTNLSFSGIDNIIYLDAAAQFSYPENHILDSLNKSYAIDSIYKFYEIFKVYSFLINDQGQEVK